MEYGFVLALALVRCRYRGRGEDSEVRIDGRISYGTGAGRWEDMDLDMYRAAYNQRKI